jgi:GTP pyrophosphokinase
MVAHKDKLASAPLPQSDLAGWARSLMARLDAQQRPLLEAAVALFAQRRQDLTIANGEDDANAFVAAELLADVGFDSETLAAALLLHDFANAAVTVEQIRTQLNPSVAELLEGVQRMRVIHDLRQRQGDLVADQNQWEALRRMVFAMASDVRVVIVTLAWCVAHLRAAKTKSFSEQRAIAGEALDLYAPLANRLGIWQIKWEIEDLALRYLEPERYKEIARLLEERRVDRERYIASFIEDLQTALRDAGIDAEVKGRPKHIYSIWKKMQRKNLGFQEIFDIRAVRVITKTVAECYAVLSVVHSRWNYVRSEFDDYIAAPKENAYQSLHTAVLGPEERVVEVQIRSSDMDQHAELGVAAHWRYKEGAGVDLTLERKLTWLRQLLDWRDTVVSSPAAVDASHDDAVGERIYVFTPKGKIIDLPGGATPLDFAYHIHSDVGHRCRGAKVADKIIPLTSPLHNGDVVEILTIKQGGPSRDWLNPNLGYLKSAKARDKVAQWFKQQNYDEDVAHGRMQLEKELHRVGMADVNFERLAQRFDYGKPDKLFAAVGRGEVKASQLAHALQQSAPAAEVAPRIVAPPRSDKSKSDIYIEGEGNLLTHFAKCCKPVPGDDVMGYITRGRGVTVHRRDCAELAHYRVDAPERVTEVTWGVTSETTYPVDVSIVASDRQGLLRDITSTLANERINVTGTHSVSDTQTNVAYITFTLQMKDISQLSRLLSQIGQLPSVISAKRA